MAFFAAVSAIVPLSVAYGYYHLQLAEGFILTTGWIVRNMVVMAAMVMAVVTAVFWAMHVQGGKP